MRNIFRVAIFFTTLAVAMNLNQFYARAGSNHSLSAQTLNASKSNAQDAQETLNPDILMAQNSMHPCGDYPNCAQAICQRATNGVNMYCTCSKSDLQQSCPMVQCFRNPQCP
jgi:hypothetical protein